MRTFTTIVLALLASAAVADAPRLGVAEPPAKPDGAVRLATYNLLNLFDDRDDPSLSGRFDDMNSVKPSHEKAALADVIRRLDADVLGLQEIESFSALIEFREEHLAGMGYDHAISIDVGQERGIEQAVLSRYPIVEARVRPNLALGGVHPEKYGDQPNWNAGEPLELRRSPLEVTIEIPAHEAGAKPYRLTLLVVHHKSGRYSGYWREAETAGVLRWIAELQRADPNRNIAVLGDFNAQPDEKSVADYLAAGFLDAFPDRRPGDPRTSTHESGRAIDLILLNPQLNAEVVPGSAFVLGAPLRPEGADWRTTPAPEGYASDHLPVAIDLIPQDR